MIGFALRCRTIDGVWEPPSGELPSVLRLKSTVCIFAAPPSHRCRMILPPAALPSLFMMAAPRPSANRPTPPTPPS